MPEGHDADVLAGRRPARLVRLRACRSRPAGRARRCSISDCWSRSADAPSRPSALRGRRRRPRAGRARHRGRSAASGCRRSRAASGWSTLAVAERDAALRAVRAADHARHDTRHGLRLDGEKRFVLQGVTADAFLVAARDGDGVSVVLVSATTRPGSSSSPRRRSRKDRQSSVRLDGVTLPRSALCGSRKGPRGRALERAARTFSPRSCAPISSAAATRCSR